MKNARPKVLWIHHSAVVGAWRHGRVRALGNEGIDVTVVSARRWNEGGAIVELAKQTGEAVTGISTWGTHPFLFGFNPFPLRELLTQTRFDVIDAHEEPASVALAEILTLARSTQPTTPVVCYSAQNILKKYPLPFGWLEGRALSQVAAVHSCNEDVEQVLRTKGFTGEVVNLGLGVDVDHFSPTKGDSGSAASAGRLHVGFVGRIEERKGVFVLLNAVGATEGVELTFVGDGPARDRLQDAIASRGLTGRVTVRGYVDHDDLPGLYRSFDTVVVPSLDTASWLEQFGRVVVEAMASGVPTIVSDAGALAEVAGDASIIVPEGDGKRLAEALVSLRDSADLRAELRAKGLVRAAHFSWSNIAKEQAALYRRVAR